MVMRDLREFLRILEERGELERISEEIDPKFEVGAINRLAVLRRGPGLLFENIKGAPAPVGDVSIRLPKTHRHGLWH